MARSLKRSPLSPRRQRSSRGRADLGGVILGALAILVGSAALGVVVNHVSPQGVSLLAAHSDDAEAPPLELPAGLSSLPLDQAQAMFESESALFIDARPPEEYGEGHIPGARNLPAYEFEEYFLDLMDLVEEAATVVVYCGGVECSDSIQVAERLLEIGHSDIRVFENGWRAWSEAGGPVNEGPEP
jgi:rhodanese-related sulfurtransferase